MKILALTSIRSDYDLLSPLYKKLHNDPEIELKILVSGAHLSSEFGETVRQIKDDGFEILCELETLINSDTNRSRLKTASILLQNSIDIVDYFNPDLMIYAGDREDVIIASLLGSYLTIPTAHFYGGDHEFDGHQDTYIRHAASKLSSFHFVVNKEHKERLVAIGENPRRIFNVGSIALDKFLNFSYVDYKKTLSGDWEGEEFALVIYHPVDGEDVKIVFSNILSSLEELGIPAFVSYPNCDPGYRDISSVIDTYRDNSLFHFYSNMERNLFLTIFSESQFLLGNSSAGIYEASFLSKPAINVGLRQKGRLSSNNIIYSNTDKESIQSAIHQCSTLTLEDIKSIHGNGGSAMKAYKIIKKMNINNEVSSKVYDPLNPSMSKDFPLGG